MTTPQEYPVHHFELMARLYLRLGAVPAQLLEHSYSPQSFGSWWSIVRVMGLPFRVVFDGRDGTLVVERSGTTKEPYEWSEWRRVSVDVVAGDLDKRLADVFQAHGNSA